MRPTEDLPTHIQIESSFPQRLSAQAASECTGTDVYTHAIGPIIVTFHHVISSELIMSDAM